MHDKQPMRADGKGSGKAADGVSNPPTQGESVGGTYPHPGRKQPPGFDGGQSDKAYSGPDNPNATTKGDD